MLTITILMRLRHRSLPSIFSTHHPISFRLIFLSSAFDLNRAVSCMMRDPSAFSQKNEKLASLSIISLRLIARSIRTAETRDGNPFFPVRTTGLPPTRMS